MLRWPVLLRRAADKEPPAHLEEPLAAEGAEATWPSSRALRRPVAPEPLELDELALSSPAVSAASTPASKPKKTRGLTLDPALFGAAVLPDGACYQLETSERSVESSPDGSLSEFYTPHGQSNVVICLTPVNHGKPGHISFSSPLTSVVPITPYSQIYGLHPRMFNFDRNGTMLPTPCSAGPPSASASMELLAPQHSTHGGFFLPPVPPLPTTPVEPPLLPPGTPYLRASKHVVWRSSTAAAVAPPRQVLAL